MEEISEINTILKTMMELLMKTQETLKETNNRVAELERRDTIAVEPTLPSNKSSNSLGLNRNYSDEEVTKAV